MSAEIYKGLTAAQNENSSTALHRWKRLAEQSNDFAHGILVVMYDFGTGRAIDILLMFWLFT